MKQRLTFLILAFAILFLITSCASFGPTSPNVSIIDLEYDSSPDDKFVEAQAILDELSTQNDLLARELGKLPEMQEGIDQGDLEALRVIRTVYEEHPKAFDAAFAVIYKVGKPEVRRYCSPLQAVYWLAEDGYQEVAEKIIQDGFSIRRLLYHSWLTETGLEDRYMKQEVDLLINSCVDDEVKILMSQMDRDHEYFYSSLFGLYEREPQAFKYKPLSYEEALESNSNEMVQTHLSRWGDFIVVTERLNAPELIDWYSEHVLSYERYIGDRKTNKSVFRNRKGNCVDQSQFISFCIKAGGFPSGLIWVQSNTPEGHAIVYYKEAGAIYIIDNGITNTVNMGIKGPYKNFHEIPYNINEVNHQFTKR